MNKFNRQTTLFLLIILLGAWFRLIGVFQGSFAFTYDVGRDLLAVRQIVVDHRPTLIGPTTGFEGIFYGPWWYYFLSIPFWLSGGSPVFINLIVALIGVLGIILIYRWARQVNNDSFFALTLASLFAFSEKLIGVSQQIWSPYLIPTALVVVLIVIELIFQKRKFAYLWLGLIIGLIIDLGIIFGITFLIGVLISLPIVWKNKFNKWLLLEFSAGFGLTLFPRIWFDLRHDFLIFKGVIKFIGNFSAIASGLPFNDRLNNRLWIFWDSWRGTTAGFEQIWGIVFLVFTVSMLVFGFRKFDSKQKLYFKTALIILLTFFFCFLFYGSDIWDHYMIGLPVFYLLFFTWAIWLFKKIIKKRYRGFFYLFLGLVFFVNLDLPNLGVKMKPPLFEGDAAVYRNQLAAVDYVYRQAGGKSFSYIAYTPPLYDYNYRYLINWYGKKYFSYTPSKDQSELFFVIMEPDFQMPERLENWLKVRENDGLIISEVVVKGGIRVQTRQR